MYSIRLGVGFALVALVAGCSAQRARPRGPSTLVVRAWSQPEPLTTRRAWTAVEFAAAQVGKPYCWGGTGMRCFDCSGLVQRAWRAAGVRLPRTADAMAKDLPAVPTADVRAGDILWWPGHVGMYVGYGWMVEALDKRDGVVRRPAGEPRRALRPAASR